MLDTVKSLPLSKILRKECYTAVIQENVGPHSFLYPVLNSFDATSIGRISNEAVSAFGVDVTVGEIVEMEIDDLKKHIDLGPKRRAWLEAYFHLFGLRFKGSDTAFALDREMLVAIDVARMFTQSARIANTEPAAMYQTILNSPLSVLDLSVRAHIRLERDGVSTVRELTSKTEAELMRIPNFGKECLQSVRNSLSALGLRLGME